jgi:hypothetical protein
MSVDPTERLEALRREVMAEAEPASAAASPTPATPAATAPPTAAPAVAAPAVAAPAVAAPAVAAPAVAAPRPVVAPDRTPAPSAAPATSLAPVEPAGASPAPPTQPDEPDAGWSLSSLTEALSEGRLGTWIGIGLLVVGGYLVASLLVPGIELAGSLLLLAAGVVLLAAHFTHRASAWALYVGALLTGIGGLRVVGGFLPFDTEGMTAMGIGLGFLAIAYLRRTQAGGYGWQGVVGVIALGFGLLQFGVGLLPGDTGLLDLVVPVVVIGLGGLILLRLTGRATA